MKIIDNITSKMSLNESAQGEKEVKFAIINPETGETITPFCKCKDYFGDMFWSRKTNKNVMVYGFSWTPDKHKEILDNPTITIAVKLVSRSGQKILKLEESVIAGVKDFLSRINSGLQFKPTEVSLCEEEKHLIITYDKSWTDYPYLHSAFLLFVRLGFTWDGSEDILTFYTGNPKNFIAPYDEGYVRSTKIKIEDILKGKIDKKQKYESYISDYAMHNYSGIVNYKEYSV